LRVQRLKEGSKPINGLIPENHEHRNGDFTRDQNFLSGLSPSYLSLLVLYYCLYTLWIRVYLFTLKREWWDKSYTRTWGKYKIGRWYNHSPRPRVLFGFGTCDNPTQRRNLGSILCQREYSCLACYFQVTVKVENL